MEKRAAPRSQLEENLSMIDGASAILSQNGGKTFSVKSAFLGSLKSMRTPRSQISNCSPSSTVSRRNPETWSRYRSKAKGIRADTVDSIFDAKSSPRGSAHGSEHPSAFLSNKISPPRIIPQHCGHDQPNLLLKKASHQDYET